MAEKFSRISMAVQRARSNPRVWLRQTTGLSPWKFIRFMGKNTNCKHPVGSPKKGKKFERLDHGKSESTVCEHMRLDETDIEGFCKRPKQVKCFQCKLLLTVFRDGIYICISCGVQACEDHIAVKSDNCDCNLVHKINTSEIWCRKCKLRGIPKFGGVLLERYSYNKCVHLRRDYLDKDGQPIKLNISSFLEKCHRCINPSKKNNLFICLECGKKTCCVDEATLHNTLQFYHYLSVEISTGLLHCLNCGKHFNIDEPDYEKYIYLKQRCKDILSYYKLDRTKSKLQFSLPTKPLPLYTPLPLYNTGNICYFIAIIQNLRNCRVLNDSYKPHISGNCFKRSYFICEEDIKVDCDVKPVTAVMFRILNANNQKELQLYVKDLMNMIRERNKRFAIGTQQDSHEALRQIFEELREEEIKNVKTEIQRRFTAKADETSGKENDNQLKDYLCEALRIQTVIDEVFGGKTVNTIICRECFNILQIIESQLDFSLPISEISISERRKAEKKLSTSFAEDQVELRAYLKDHDFLYRHWDEDYSVDPFTIEQCLQNFVTLDVLDENNKFICDKCVYTKAECLCSKQLLIHSLPKVLLLHLKRFHLYPKVAKNNTYIKFPLVLNVAPFCTDDCFQEITRGNDLKGKILYALKGVLVHEGSLQFGHYYTYLRTDKLPNDNQHNANCDEAIDIEGDWYCANDDNITHISGAKNALPTRVAKSSGYLLFYEQLQNQK